MSAPRILVVDDEADIRDLLQEILVEEGYEVAVAADVGEARGARKDAEPDLVLLDIWMPDADGISLLREWRDANTLEFPVVMMSGHGTVDTAVEATRLGAFDYVEKPLSLTKLLHTVERALREGRSQRKSHSRQLLPPLAAPIGKSKLVQALRDQIARVAPHDTPVLFSGEPGSGREAYARYTHSLSASANGPFVCLAAGSVTEGNMERLLFGHQDEQRGEAGVLERASGGVLFISDLQDLDAGAQRLLLGTLEQGSFMRCSGHDPVKLNARFITSIRRDQSEAAEPVRPDLMSYLNVVTLQVPALRAYNEDVPELLRYYVDLLVDNEGLPFRRFGVASQNRLRNYPWPGNIQELKNAVHRLLVLGGEEEISLEEVEQLLEVDAPTNEPLVKHDLLALPLREAREQFERAYLKQQLQLCGGKVQLLAKRVGMERTHLYRKLRTLGVDFRGTNSSDE